MFFFVPCASKVSMCIALCQQFHFVTHLVIKKKKKHFHFKNKKVYAKTSFEMKYG